MWNVIPENKKPQRSDAENACTENLHWIFDISSRWSKVRYLSAPIKRKHGYKLGRTRIEFRARNHVNESLVTVNLSMYCYRLWVVPPFRRSPSCESKKLKHSYKLGRTGIEFRARNHVIFALVWLEKYAPELREDVSALPRTEWGTNINLFFTEFSDLRDGLRRKRGTARSLVLLSPVTLNKMLCLVLNVHTGFNMLS